MDQSKLIEQVLRIINSNYSNIYVIDIEMDKVYLFDFTITNSLVIKEEITITDFIEMANRFVHFEDANKYFDALSLNKLENHAIKGNSEVKVKYRKLFETGEYRWCVNIINYLPFENKRLIFMMSEDVNDRLIDSEENNIKLNKEVINYKNRINADNESISDAIYQINRLFEHNKNVSGSDDTRLYINSIFDKVSNDNPELNKALFNRISDSTNFLRPTILIADDSSIIRNSLKRIFEDDFNIIFAKNGNEAVDIITRNILNTNNKTYNIAGILLDLEMPESDGFVVLDFMKNFNLFKKVPVAIVSGDETRETRKRVYEYDIVDMLEKPFNTSSIKRRISKIISLYISGNNLENIISDKTQELENSVNVKNIESVKAIIIKIVDNIVKKEESQKLRKIVQVIANGLSNNYPKYNLDNKYIDAIVNGCSLYNVGSISIPNNEVITNSSIIKEIGNGLEIIDVYIEDEYQRKVTSNIIKYSLELYNGKGAPNGIKGDEIPIEAQIVNLIVRLNFLMKSKSLTAAIKSIKDNESSRYNPDLIDILNNSKKELKEIV